MFALSLIIHSFQWSYLILMKMTLRNLRKQLEVGLGLSPAADIAQEVEGGPQQLLGDPVYHRVLLQTPVTALRLDDAHHITLLEAPLAEKQRKPLVHSTAVASN